MDTTVPSGDLRLAVRDYGGDGSGLLLVHGLSSNLAIWELTAPLLTDRFRVVAYDQRNHGHSSDADDFSFAALAGDADAVVRSLGLEGPVVVGHSWGASVALHLAAVQPGCRGVVCVDGGVIDTQGMGLGWEAAAELMRPPEIEGTPDELFARFREEQSVLPWDAAEAVFRRGFPVGEDGVMRRRLPIPKHMQIAHELWAERIADVHARVTCPVLVVLASGAGLGERERGFVEVKREGARRLHERFPAMRVEWLPSVHDVPLLRPGELAQLIGDFAASCSF